VPQLNGFDCGLFTIKFAELFVRTPSYELGKEIKENMPDRLEIKRHFVGLYAKYRRSQYKDVELLSENSDVEETSSTSVDTHKASDDVKTSNHTSNKRSKPDDGMTVGNSDWKRLKPNRERSDIKLRNDVETALLSKDIVNLQLKSPVKKINDVMEECSPIPNVLDNSNQVMNIEHTPDINVLEPDVNVLEPDVNVLEPDAHVLESVCPVDTGHGDDISELSSIASSNVVAGSKNKGMW